MKWILLCLLLVACAHLTDEVKVAFIADQGVTEESRAVLELIKEEHADIIIHQGDLGYEANADQWDAQITEILGDDFPLIFSIGNHDVNELEVYQQKLSERFKKNDANCRGTPGVMASCKYKNLLVVSSAIGLVHNPQEHLQYVQNQLDTPALWHICSWHLNQREMQVGEKENEAGLDIYELCRDKGALIFTGHEHSYHRTHILSNIQKKEIADNSSPYNLKAGQTMVIVSGLGGKSIRHQERCLHSEKPYGCPEWAAIYTSDQDADYGALFCTFRKNYADCYFKDIRGRIIDEFVINRGD